MKKIMSALIASVLVVLVINSRVFANFDCDSSIGECDVLDRQLDIADSNLILPNNLKKGDTVALLSSAGKAKDDKIVMAKERLENLGYHVLYGNYTYGDFHSFTGTDEQRAEDIHNAFLNRDVKAIFEVRGGWGSNLVLPCLDFNIIRENPKPLVGFSDITSLLLAINSKTNMVTFHGPMPGVFEWSNITIDCMRRVLDGEQVKFFNQSEDPIHTIHGGVARGKLIGGNLAVFQSMIGTGYLPGFEGAILFLEDVNEPSYKIQKMIVQLEQSGILGKISGFVFGKCTDCKDESYYTRAEIFDKHIKPLGIPAWYGAMFGHQNDMFTLPVGAMVEINADEGSIEMLHPAVNY